MAMDAFQVFTSCFTIRQTPKSKRMYKMGKVGVQIGTYRALKLVASRYLILKCGLGSRKENAVIYCLSAVIWLYLQCNFQKNF